VVSPALRLGDVEVRPAERQVLVGTRPVHLGSRAFDVLLALMQRADRVVGKDELLDLVWPGVVVEENNLQVQISALRKLLGAHAIATVPGRGYRLTLAPEGAQRPGSSSPPSAPPSTAAPLFGRADDLRAVRDLVSRHPLVSLTGAGGIGKTRLARAVHDEVQADFAGGAYWVEFAPLSDPALVPGAMAQAVGLKVGEGRPPLQALVSFLREESVLLVLDNCEHLVESIADCVSALVRGAGRVRILATSQEPLKTEDEVVYRLGTLAVGAPGSEEPGGAVELFVTRALAADPRLTFDASAMAAATEICRRLDGIPLAIELAAARVPLLGLQGLCARLSERFHILTGGARTVMRRHQTLRATLEWSHGLLSVDERRVFRRLGVFVGSFPLALAQRVAADDAHDSWAVLDLLGHLVDKSLVMVEGTDAEPRYHLLETTRQYALEELALADETRQWLRRHAEATRDYLGELDERHNVAPIPVELFLAEIDNLRSALDWAATEDRPLAASLMGRSNRVWHVSSQQREALARCRALLPLPSDLPVRERALFLLAHANAGSPSFSHDALQAAREAVELFAAQGDDFRCLTALRHFIFIGAKRCDDGEIAAASERARKLLRPDTQHRLVAALAAAEGLWHLMRSRDHEAIECSEWQRSLYHAHGDEAGVWMAEANLAYQSMMVGNLADAIVRLERAIAEQKRLTPAYGLAPALSCLAWGLALKGDLERALQIGREAIPYARREGDLTWILHVLAVVHSLRGDPLRACKVLGFAVAELARLGMVERPIVLQQQQEVWDRATAELGPDEVERCKATGARISEDEAVTLALANAG
jgi:predicted ATPase/DNA-binding winged helix-turn-helix (wHTH) protein